MEEKKEKEDIIDRPTAKMLQNAGKKKHFLAAWRRFTRAPDSVVLRI